MDPWRLEQQITARYHLKLFDANLLFHLGHDLIRTREPKTSFLYIHIHFKRQTAELLLGPRLRYPK